MAKKVILKDQDNVEILPITRGELILDSSGKEAFRSNDFLATTSQPGLMSSEDKTKIASLTGGIIDSELSLTSENPVQNKVVTQVVNTNTKLANDAQSTADEAKEEISRAKQLINSIRESYLKSASISGNTLTIKDQSDTEIEFYNTTYAVVSQTANGLAPSIGTAASATIATQADEWVLTSTKGGTPTWKKLPVNAFKNDNSDTTYTFTSGNGGFIVTPSGGSNQFVSIGYIDGQYINKLTGYSKTVTRTAIEATDTLNTALGKLEYKSDLGVTAYDLVNAAYDGDGTIENLQEILTVLEGIKDTDTIQAIVGKYLPLTGGTITGTLTICRDSAAIQYCNSGGTAQGWLGFSAENTPTVWMSNGSTYHTLLHSGNFFSYAPTLTGVGAIGTWRINIDGNAATATSSVKASYIESQGRLSAISNTTKPVNNGLTIYEIYNNGYPTTYGNLLQVKGGSGSGELAMGWTASDACGNLYYRSIRDNTHPWSVWKRLAFADEIPAVTNYYWANIKVSSSSSSSTSPIFATATAGQFIANNASGPHFTGTSTAGNWAYLRLNNSSVIWDIATRTNSGSGGLWLSRYNGNDNGIFVSAASIPKVGINTISPAYSLHVSGDSYTTGWSRAASGFYVEDKGVHYMSNNIRGYGQIYLTSNEFNWSASSTILFFNYRAGANGTTVTNYVWNAGSSSSYASHTLGALVSRGIQTLYGRTDTCNIGNTSTGTYSEAAAQIREYNFGGAQADTWGNAPRLTWHWSGRVAAQIGLASNGYLYTAPLTATNWYKLVYESGTWGINISGNASSASALYTGYASGSSHANALQTYFNANKASIPRNKTISFYSSAYSNGSQYMGYFLSGYDSNPYGGFFVAHYGTPYYVGISNGSYAQSTILTTDNYTAILDGRYVNVTGDTMTGTLHMKSQTGNYSEGIRIYSYSSWSTLMLLGTDITAASGTSTGSWGLFNNAGTFYINKGTSSGANNARAMGTSTGWTFGNTSRNSYALNTASFICDSWVRTCGATGWYNESYGGGIYMEDSTWIRAYNNKKIYVANTDSTAFYTSGGVTALGHMYSTITGSSWLDGQRYNNAAYNITNSPGSDSYSPWMRQTLASGRWVSIGTLQNSLYFIGSVTSRTANSYDYGFRMDFSNGYLYGNFSGYLSGTASYATTAGTANSVAWANVTGKPSIPSFGAKGSTTQGVYLSGTNTFATMTYSLKATVNAGTASRLAYYSGTNAVSAYTSNMGSYYEPIYLSGGIPTSCYARSVGSVTWGTNCSGYVYVYQFGPITILQGYINTIQLSNTSSTSYVFKLPSGARSPSTTCGFSLVQKDGYSNDRNTVIRLSGQYGYCDSNYNDYNPGGTSFYFTAAYI